MAKSVQKKNHNRAKPTGKQDKITKMNEKIFTSDLRFLLLLFKRQNSAELTDLSQIKIRVRSDYVVPTVVGAERSEVVVVVMVI